MTMGGNKKNYLDDDNIMSKTVLMKQNTKHSALIRQIYPGENINIAINILIIRRATFVIDM